MQSLAKERPNSHASNPDVVKESYLKALALQDSDRRKPETETKEPESDLRKVCNFNLESLVQFKNDQVDHTADKRSEVTPRVRRYDGQKRKFLATLPPERKKHFVSG